MTFKVTAPADKSVTFTVKGYLSAPLGGAAFTQGDLTVLMSGTANAKSRIACVGQRSKTSSVRVSERAICTVSPYDSKGPTTAQKSQFKVPLSDGGTGFDTVFVEAGDLKSLSIKLSAPTSLSTLFTVTGRLADGTLFEEGKFGLTMVGTPTEANKVACVGAVSKRSTDVRVSEEITCTITINDASGTTTGFAADFADPTITGGTSRSPASGVTVTLSKGAGTATFNFTSPSVIGTDAKVEVKLNDPVKTIASSPVNLEVVGSPTEALPRFSASAT